MIAHQLLKTNHYLNDGGFQCSIVLFPPVLGRRRELIVTHQAQILFDAHDHHHVAGNAPLLLAPWFGLPGVCLSC